MVSSFDGDSFPSVLRLISFLLWPGVCTRPSEIVPLFVGSHGPTMNVYIAKWLSLPALRTAHAYDYGPAHRQTGSRKQEQEASTRHSRSRHGDEQMDGQTDRWINRADGSAPLYLCRLLQRCRWDAVKKEKTDRQKKVTDPYMYQNLEAILLFWSLNHAHRHQNEKQWKKCWSLLLVGSRCADISTSPP